MSKETTHAAGDAAEKKDSNTGKLVGGGIAAVIGAVIGALLIGDYAILPAASVVGLLGVALGAVFD
ncbi:hypothetical protein [Methylocystis echinoides]|jgi:hypothetical protein|uniref:hypothetical protein n=1 Tax=Methylocystis echinoides TaxID=29468 RepID=UPI00342678AE